MDKQDKVITTNDDYVIILREGRYIKIPLISEQQFIYEKEQVYKNIERINKLME